MIFRQLFDALSSAYTYVLGDPAAAQAVVIDPAVEHWRRAALARIEVAPLWGESILW